MITMAQAQAQARLHAKADTGARKIKRAYIWAAEKNDAVDAAIKNPDTSEEAFDALLDAYDRALDRLADAITEGTGGAVSPAEADRLVRHKFERLGAIVARLQI